MVQAAPHLERVNYRTRRRMDLSQGNYDGVDEARWFFHSANWQMIEEHVDSDDDGDIERVAQQFWGVRYIDDAVGRRIDRDADGDWTTSPGDNFYYLTDAMFSVRAVVDSSGLLHTRVDYTPYGVAMHGFGADVNGDGVVTLSDLGVVSTNYNGGGGSELKPGDTGYDPDAFLDGGDTINLTTYLSRYSPYVAGGSNPTFNDGWIDNPTDSNGPDNSVGYDGYWFDLAGATEATSSGLYMVRHRVYDPRLGRWLRRDPAGYVDGSNRYQFAISNPVGLSDSFGLNSTDPYPSAPFFPLTPLPQDGNGVTLFDPWHPWTQFQDPSLWGKSDCKPSHIFRNGNFQVFDQGCATECANSPPDTRGLVKCSENTPGGKKEMCCVCTKKVDGPGNAARHIIASCIRVHEEWHWNTQPDCDEKTGVHTSAKHITQGMSALWQAKGFVTTYQMWSLGDSAMMP